MNPVYTDEPAGARSGFCLKELPADELPREKCMNLGPEYLSDAELLALLFRSGTRQFNAVDLGRNVLNQFGGLQGISRRTWHDFATVPGLGPVRSVVLEAALELGRRAQRPVGAGRKLQTPQLVFREMSPRIGHLHHEEFYVLYLTRACELIQIRKLSSGSATGTMVDPAEVLRVALFLRAGVLVLVHNHPAGTLNASREDIALTEKLTQAAETMNLTVADHVIIAGDRYLSLKNEGLIKERSKTGSYLATAS